MRIVLSGDLLYRVGDRDKTWDMKEEKFIGLAADFGNI